MPVIYKILSPSGKIYIGSTVNFKRRMAEYKSLRNSKQHKLLNSFKKYGFDNHQIDIICECSDFDRYERENYFGILYNCIGNNGLNLKLPLKTDIYSPTDKSVKDKISAANRLRVVKDSTKEKIRIARTGVKYSEERRLKMIGIRKGVKQSPEHIAKRAKSKEGKVYDYSKSSINGKLNLGKKRTEEQKLLLSKIRTGFIHKEETKNKISMANSGKIRTKEYKIHLSNIKKGIKNNKLRILLLNKYTGIFYIGIQEAADSLGIKYDKLFGMIRRGKSDFIKLGKINN